MLVLQTFMIIFSILGHNKMKELISKNIKLTLENL